MSNPIIDVTLEITFDSLLMVYRATVTATFVSVGNEIQTATAALKKNGTDGAGSVTLEQASDADGVATWTGTEDASVVEDDIVVAELSVLWRREDADKARSNAKKVPAGGFYCPPSPTDKKAKKPTARKKSAKRKTNAKKTAKKNRIATIVTPPKEVKE